MAAAPMTQPAEIKPVAVPGPEDSSDFLCPEHLLPGLGGHKIGDFWQWAYSDLLSNRNRSVLVEYFVGVALGVVEKPRVEWDAVDLRYRGFSIEVKSSAYCQSWPQKKTFTDSVQYSQGDLLGSRDRRAQGRADSLVRCLYLLRSHRETDRPG